MKNKNGLGRIPKSLSWIDTADEIVNADQVPAREVKIEQQGVKHSAASKINHIKHTEPLDAFEPKSEKSSISAQSTSCQKGLPNGWTRATFIVDQELNEKIKALAYWERLTVKEVMHEALKLYMQDKNVKSIPKKK